MSCDIGTIFIDRDGTTVLSMVFCAWAFARLIHTDQCLCWIAGGNVGLPLDTT